MGPTYSHGTTVSKLLVVGIPSLKWVEGLLWTLTTFTVLYRGP